MGTVKKAGNALVMQGKYLLTIGEQQVYKRRAVLQFKSEPGTTLNVIPERKPQGREIAVEENPARACRT